MTQVLVLYSGHDDDPGPILRSDINDTQHAVHGAYGLVPLLSPGGTLDVIGHAHLAVTWVEAVPFEVRFAFTMLDGRHGPQWQVSRHLLTAGGGDGDVVVEHPGEQVLVHLSSPTGRIVLGLDPSWLDRFLDETNDIVAAGSEFERIEWIWENSPN